MRNLIIVAVLVASVLGCKKDKAAPPSGAQGGPEPAVDGLAAQAQAVAQALGIPDAAGHPAWKAGPLKEDVAVEPLGIKLDHPENLALAVDGNTVRLTAEGFYPVAISVDKLTLENAELKLEVNGVAQPAQGRTTSGGAAVIQTDCLLIKCTVETPEGWYLSEVADAGRAICDSIEVPPPPTAPALDAVTSSNSTGGQCPEGTMDLGNAFLDAVKADEMKAALEKCWVDAVAANPAWKGGKPTLDLTLRFWDSWTREAGIRDLEGDTAALLQCFTAATASLDAKIPAAPLEGNCTLTSVAYVRFGERVACP
jgi:hypothetical protein